MLLRVQRHDAGPRLFIFGARFHHWHAGIALILWGAWLVVVDRSDLPGVSGRAGKPAGRRRTATAGTSPTDPGNGQDAT